MISFIPFPSLRSWMFNRCDIPRTIHIRPEIAVQRSKEYYRVNSYLSRLAAFFHIFSWKWAAFKFILSLFRWYFKIFNRLEIIDKKNIPKNAGIFYVNHPGSLDPIILNAAVGKPIGCFVAWDNYWLTQMGERYTFINKDFYQHCVEYDPQKPEADVFIEQMIRNILFKNAYFAIWPEGGLSRKPVIYQGFSSIVKVYATLNHNQDRIPFVPVLLKGSECYHIDKNPRLRPRTQKITVQFLKPFFLPRNWLVEPNGSNEGKTARELTDYIMNVLVQANHQKKLYPNRKLVQIKTRLGQKRL